jgi:hypothetical protein
MKSNLRLLKFLILITIATGVVWWMDKDNGNIGNDAFANFAIEDTSLVTKIFIADNAGEATLTREVGDRYWTLNGEYKTRDTSTDLLLKTFKRAAVKGAVDEKKRETVIRNLAGSAKKVEIYTGGDTPVKTWYVGSATPCHTGTYMLLETPEGKSSEPFIVHMEGFTGFLTTRFFSSIDEWRYTGIFHYPNRSLSEVSVVDHKNNYNTFTLRADSVDVLDLFISTGIEIGYTDTLKIQDQFLRFRKVHFESFNSRLSPAEEDSLKLSAPSYTITCKGVDGSSSSVVLFDKDEEHMYGLTEDNQVVLVQTFVFNPLTVGLHSLLELR